MSILVILFMSACFLAHSNGANDNFKGVASLFGSKTASYRTSIIWATFTTFLGSICSIFLAKMLMKSFSGKGLVPDMVTSSPDFLIAVAMGAAITVVLATLLGFPVSTTHSLIGALVGAGVMAVGKDVNFSVLGQKFFMPLILSPFIAVILAALSYISFRFFRIKMGIKKEFCVCVGQTEQIIAMEQPESVLYAKSVNMPTFMIGEESECIERYSGSCFGISCQKILDFFHFCSAGLVSFARGLNDTPKIAALLIAINALKIDYGIFIIGACIAVGGLLNSRKIAETMGNNITPMNHGQGFTANLITGILVLFASRWGMPVSTTHASCGSLFGIGLVSGKGNFKVISSIILSWILTLPIAAIMSGFVYYIISISKA